MRTSVANGKVAVDAAAKSSGENPNTRRDGLVIDFFGAKDVERHRFNSALHSTRVLRRSGGVTSLKQSASYVRTAYSNRVLWSREGSSKAVGVIHRQLFTLSKPLLMRSRLRYSTIEPVPDGSGLKS